MPFKLIVRSSPTQEIVNDKHSHRDFINHLEKGVLYLEGQRNQAQHYHYDHHIIVCGAKSILIIGFFYDFKNALPRHSLLPLSL